MRKDTGEHKKTKELDVALRSCRKNEDVWMSQRVKIGRERFRSRIKASKPNPHRGDTRRHAATVLLPDTPNVINTQPTSGCLIFIQDWKDATVAMMGTDRHVTSLANQHVSRRRCRNVRLKIDFSLRVWGINPGGVFNSSCSTHLIPLCFTSVS